MSKKPHDAWFEKSIWLIDALTDATRELRPGNELESLLDHLRLRVQPTHRCPSCKVGYYALQACDFCDGQRTVPVYPPKAEGRKP